MDRERSALLTDGGRMKGLLQAEVPDFAAGNVVIEGCDVLHTRYRTSADDRRRGRPFLSVAYKLAVRDTARAGRGVRLVHARAYCGGRSREKFERASTAAAHLPELDAVVWAFPDDPRLPHLPEVIDPEAVVRHLPYHRLPAGLGSPADLHDVDVHVVRYKPEVRCITRYRLVGDTQAFTLFGKTFRHERAAEISRRMESVWSQLASDPGGFVVPRPLGWSGAVKTVWQTALAGTPMMKALDRGDHREFLDAAARGLAGLHRIDLGGLPRTSLGDRMRAVRWEASELAQAFPAARDRLESIASRLERDVPRLPPCREALVHGDFLLKQLVVNDGRLGVFDFDNFAIGDPIQDVANCIVDLHCHGLDPSLVRAITAEFLASYRAHADRAVPADRLRWHSGVQLLRDAYYWHKRKQLMPGFEDELGRILSLAEDPPIGAETQAER